MFSGGDIEEMLGNCPSGPLCPRTCCREYMDTGVYGGTNAFVLDY